jgi:hypothetical protein
VTHPCSEPDPEAHAGADVEDDWDIYPIEEEVPDDGHTVDLGSMPDRA